MEYANEHIGLGAQVVSTRFYAPLFHNTDVVDVKKLTVREKEHTEIFTTTIKPRQWAEFAVSRIQISQQQEFA